MQHGTRLFYRNVRLRAFLIGGSTLLAALFLLWLWSDTQKVFLFFVYLSLFVFGSVHLLNATIYLPYVLPRVYFKRVAALGKLMTVVDDSGILEKAENLQAFHNWKAVEKHIEDQDGIVIFFVSKNFKYIPKRLLNAEDEKELKEKLSQLS